MKVLLIAPSHVDLPDVGVEVARPIPGTPAYRAGVLGGDVIIAVSDMP